jgi:hypothetical protein
MPFFCYHFAEVDIFGSFIHVSRSEVGELIADIFGSSDEEEFEV